MYNYKSPNANNEPAMEHRDDIRGCTQCTHITGIILAGGLSKRYGQNKAFLEIDRVRLIDRIAEQMRNIFKKVILVTNEKKDFEYLRLPMVEDLIKGLGPLGGIYTGLKSISDCAGFFIACDMLNLNKGLVHYMADVIDDHAAVVPSVGKWVEPLHAIYTQSCLGPIKGLIDEKRYQVKLFYDRVSVRYVREDEISRFCSPREAFLNINTPDEFAKILSLANH
jgi:molybdopterin-guanine dinucleotide biosynthesis protein A